MAIAVDNARRIEIGRQRRERTHASIIAVGLEVVRVHGADEPTLEDFIAASKVSKGTFYNHFRTKSDLLFALGSHVADAIDEQIIPLIEDLDDPARRISIAIRKFVLLCNERPEWGWILIRAVPGMQAGWSRGMRRGVLADIRSGIKLGRFSVPSVQVAASVGLGALAMAIQTVLVEKTPPKYGEAVAELTLRAMGMDREEAHKIANLPFRAR